MKLKEAYQEKLEAQVKEWTAKLAEMKAKADQAGADAKTQMYKQIDQLQAQKEAPKAGRPSRPVRKRPWGT